MSNEAALPTNHGVAGVAPVLSAPQEYRDIRRSYTSRRKAEGGDNSTTAISVGSTPDTRSSVRRRAQHLLQDRMHRLPASEPIYLDLSSPAPTTATTTMIPEETMLPPQPQNATRSERIRRRLSNTGNSSSMVEDAVENNNNNAAAASSAPLVPKERSVTASMDKPWWRPFRSRNSPPRAPGIHSDKNNGEQIFYMAGDDNGSVMTGMSQQELLRKKARSESKKRNNKLFGKRKKKKSNPIVSLPPGLLATSSKKEVAKGKQQPSAANGATPSLSSSTKRVVVKRKKNASSSVLDTSDSQSSAATWKAQWNGDEKDNSTAESTFTDSHPPGIPRPSSPETPAWTVVKENEGDAFFQGDEPLNSSGQCSIDEYSFPLLSTGAMGGMTDETLRTNTHDKTESHSRTLESIPEIQERSSTISASRSDVSGRVRFSSTAELSTIVGVDSDGMPLSEIEGSGMSGAGSDLYTSTYMSYMIDLDSPAPVAQILNRSGNYTPTPTIRRRKSQGELSPVQPILRPARYGDRSGLVMGGRKKTYVRAMSFLRASQILRNKRNFSQSSDDDEIVFTPADLEYQLSDMAWIPAVTEEESEHLHFVDTSGAELSPIRENNHHMISETNSKSEDWSEFEESETMQRLKFIEAVAAVVIQTSYRRHLATKHVNALRREAEIARFEQMYAVETSRNGKQQMHPVETTLAMKSWGNPYGDEKMNGDPGDVEDYARYLEMQRQVGVPKREENISVTESPREILYFDDPGRRTVDSEKPWLIRNQALLDKEETFEPVRVEPDATIEPKQLHKDFDRYPETNDYSGQISQPNESRASEMPTDQRTSLDQEEHPSDEVVSPTKDGHTDGTAFAERYTRVVQASYGDMTSPARRELQHERRNDDGSFPTLPVTPMSRAFPVQVQTRESKSEVSNTPAWTSPVKVDNSVERQAESPKVVASSKRSVDDSVSKSEISTARESKPTDTSKRKSVSSFVNKIEDSGGSNKPVLEQVVHLKGQSSVRIFASNGYKETSSQNTQTPSPRESSQPSLPPPQRRFGKKVDVAEEAPKDEETSDKLNKAAVTIQSVFRGFWARDCINVDHYCAMVIQKAFRGYFCRANYRYDKYRIILVQSVWRRSIARSDVAHILACTILIQSLVRGHQARQKGNRALVTLMTDEPETATLLPKNTISDSEATAALTIQCAWRRFSAESYLIRKLVDVLICQSIVRGWLGRHKLKKLKAAKQKSLQTDRRIGPPRQGTPRDGRPPVAPMRVKSSKLAEKYEAGLKEAEKERKDAHEKNSTGVETKENDQSLPPGGKDSTSPERNASTESTKGKEGPVISSPSTEEKSTKEDSSAANTSVAREVKRNNNKAVERVVDAVPDESSYKLYYRIWAARGLLRPGLGEPIDADVNEKRGSEGSRPVVKEPTSPPENVTVTESDAEGILEEQKTPAISPRDSGDKVDALAADDVAKENRSSEEHGKDPSRTAADSSDVPSPTTETTETHTPEQIAMKRIPVELNAHSAAISLGDDVQNADQKEEDGTTDPEEIPAIKENAPDELPQVGTVSSMISQLSKRKDNSIPTKSLGKNVTKRKESKPKPLSLPPSEDDVIPPTSGSTQSSKDKSAGQPESVEAVVQPGRKPSNRVPVQGELIKNEVRTSSASASPVATQKDATRESKYRVSKVTPPPVLPSRGTKKDDGEESTQPASSSLKSKAVVVYPEGFSRGSTRRRTADKFAKVTASEEKKETDSFDFDTERDIEKASSEPAQISAKSESKVRPPGKGEDEQDAPTTVEKEEHGETATKPESGENISQADLGGAVDNAESSMVVDQIKPSENVSQADLLGEGATKAFPRDDPHLPAYSVWYERGLLPWRPVTQDNL